MRDFHRWSTPASKEAKLETESPDGTAECVQIARPLSVAACRCCECRGADGEIIWNGAISHMKRDGGCTVGKKKEDA